MLFRTVRSLVFTVTLCAFLACDAEAQTLSTVWAQQESTIDSIGIDQPVEVLTHTDGSVYVVAYSDNGRTWNDWILQKYAGADGTLVWEKRFDSDAHRSDRPRAAALDADGNIIVTGGVNTGGSAAALDCYTAKFSSGDGTLIWDRSYVKPGPAVADQGVNVVINAVGDIFLAVISDGQFYTAKYHGADGSILWENARAALASTENARGLLIDQNGDLITAASTGGIGTSYDLHTMKYRGTDGALLWEGTHASTSSGGNVFISDTYRDLALDSNGDVIVLGDINYDVVVVKYRGSDGDQSWATSYRATPAAIVIAAAVAVDAERNIFVTGAASNSVPNGDVFLTKLNGSDGTKAWQREYNGAANQSDQGSVVRINAAGNPVVSGFSVEDGARKEDFFTAEFSRENGDILWEGHYADPMASVDKVAAAELDPTSNMLVLGSTYLPDAGFHLRLIKYAAGTGEVLWEKAVKGLGYADERVVAVVRDPQDNVVVTGYTGKGLTADWLTVKYARTGEVLWRAEFDGELHREDRPTAVATDAAGNILVTGTANAVGTMTIKYSPSGTVLWQKLDVGRPTSGWASGGGVMADADGNVIVTGGAQLSTHLDWFTAKLSAADGGLLWLSRFDGPDHKKDEPKGLAIDAAGNVIVAGYSYNLSNADCQVIKYAGSDGGLAWEKRINGPANTNDEWTDVAVDSAGNVVATGFSQDDFYTAKFATSDGAILWDQRSGFAGRSERAYAVTLDLAGDVAIAGHQNDAASGQDGYVIKYHGGSGEIAWEKLLRSESIKVYGIDTAATGNFVVAGSAVGIVAPISFDFYVAKVATTDGAVLEDKFFTAGSGLNDVPVESNWGMALGADGSVAVAGATIRSATYDEADFTTVVFANLAPVVSLTGSYLLTMEASASYTDAGATAVDAEDGSLAPVITMNTVIPNVPGSYFVTWSATDIQGTTGTATRSVTVVDTTAPTVVGPTDIVVETLDLMGANVTYDAAEISDIVGIANILYSHPSGTRFPLGTTTVSVTAHDAAGNEADATFEVKVLLSGPVHQVFATSGGAVPGAGIDPRIPSGATWTSIGVPTLSESGEVAFAGKWSSSNPKALGTGIFRSGEIVHAAGDDAGAGLFKAFADPLFSRESDTLLGRAILKGTGVSARNDDVLLTLHPALGAIWQEGAEWPGSDGVQIGGIIAYSARGSSSLVVATLRGRGVNGSNNRAAYVYNDGIVTPVVRTGQEILGKQVKQFRMLGAVVGSTGNGRGELLPAGVRFIATFKDKTEAIVDWSAPNTFALRASTSAVTTAPELPGAEWKSFGFGVSSTDDGEALAFVANLQPGVGDAIGKQPRAIFRVDGDDTHLVAEVGGGVPDRGDMTFSALNDPVLAADGTYVAFGAKVKVEGKTVAAIAEQAEGDDLRIVATLTESPAGAPSGSRWKSFQSIAAPGGGLGTVFTAALRVGAGGIKASSDQGIWAVDSLGILRCVVREGDPVGDKTLGSFRILRAESSTPGVTREFNGNREIVWAAKFTDGTGGIVKSTIP